MMQPVLTIDKGITVPGGILTAYHLYRDDLLAMVPGDSFFLSGMTVGDVCGLVAYATLGLGVQLSPHYMEPDDVYMDKGVRVWCIASNHVRINDEQGSECTRYWHHPESSCVFTTAAGEDVSKLDPLSVEITQREFDELDSMYAAVAKPDSKGMFHWTKPGVGGVFSGPKLPDQPFTLLQPDEIEPSKRRPTSPSKDLNKAPTMTDETGRRFYVIESASGNHLTWGSSLPVDKQGISGERLAAVRNISLEQFNDLENKNYEMHYWIKPEDMTQFFITSCLNTNADFHLTGAIEVPYTVYQQFTLFMKAGFVWGRNEQYVRRLKNGDCFKLNSQEMNDDQIRAYGEGYEPITQTEFTVWELDNEL